MRTKPAHGPQLYFAIWYRLSEAVLLLGSRVRAREAGWAMDQYCILGRIGEGAHGIVFKAKHVEVSRVREGLLGLLPLGSIHF